MECRAVVCPACGEDLQEQDQSLFSRHQIIDIPPVSAQVIEVRRYQAICACGRCVLGEVPQGYDELQQGFGTHQELDAPTTEQTVLISVIVALSPSRYTTLYFARWRPQIFGYLHEELADYAPM